jgi:L-fucose isomerase-like protein
MKQHVNIGVVCLGRTTFDFEEAKNIYDNIRGDLKKIPDTTFEMIEDLVIEAEDAREVGKFLASKDLDGIVVISGTFHLGHLVLELDKIVKKPIMLWGLNELPYDGGKIRLNSVCGVNLNASNLYKSGNDNFHYNISDNFDEDWLDAIRASKALKDSRIGLIGYRAHGFFNLSIDELKTYEETGVLIDHFELSEVFDMDVTQTEIDKYHTKVKELFDISELSEEQVDKVVKLVGKFKNFMNKNSLNAVAVRCWPEFAANFGVSPCAAMSILQSEGNIMGCEGDIEGVISMLVHKAIGGETPFLADLSQVDLKDDHALMWHCGVAPCNLWDEKSVRSLDTYFAGGKGVTAGFVMRPGQVNVLRIDSARGKHRMFLQNGKGMEMDKLLKGTYVKVRFDNNINNVLDKVVNNGIAHHVSLVYGDFSRPLKLFAKIKNWEIIE